jgi:aldehyde dehydrogenase (NAD+)
VDSDIHVTHTAERIVWGKFFNAGQTCVAPDYLLVQNNIKSGLIEAMKETINRFYGPDPKTSPDYARIINERHFQRLKGLLNGDIVYGGETDVDKRYIAPTLIDNVGWDDDVMVDEIFGPILPILGYDNLEECIARINSRPKPLALYVFSNNRQIQTRVLEETSAGGCTINDTLVHLSTAALPFGGVGESGYGKYHGRASFDLFSNKKSVMRRWFALDVPFRYPPFENKLPIVKRLMRYLG